jgi:hypothetical protein
MRTPNLCSWFLHPGYTNPWRLTHKEVELYQCLVIHPVLRSIGGERASVWGLPPVAFCLHLALKTRKLPKCFVF